MKKQLVQFNFPGVTSKLYDQVWEGLRNAGQSNPAGLLHHAGAQQGNNFTVIDIWESTEAFNKFGETLIPIMNKLGIAQVQPVITPVHYEYTGINTEAGIL